MRATIILGVFCWLMIGAVARGADAADKAAIPDAAAREKALKLVAEIYEKPWKEARTGAEKTALAEKMIDAAMKAQGDAAGRYVLLRVARDISVEAGDAATALRAIDLVDGGFHVDAAEMKIAAVLDAAKSAVTDAHHRAIADETFALVEAAVDKDHYDTAERLSRVAQSSARKLREGETVRAYTELSREVERIARAYNRIAPQREVLDEKPTDPEANLAVGKFLCFDKGDWRRGIPMLVLGSDKDLAALAEKELRGPETAEEQLAIADEWWERAEKPEETAKRQMQLHAGTWYESALPHVPPGLVKAKVENRLGKLRREDATPVLGSGGTMRGKNEVPKGRWIDLFRDIDVDRDDVNGRWQRVPNGIVPMVAKNSLIALPIVINGSYDLEVTFSRREGKRGTSITFPIGPRACTLVVASYERDLVGLDTVDGQPALDNRTSRRMPLAKGRAHVATIQVRLQEETAEVRAFVNGVAATAWSAKYASFDAAGAWRVPDPRRPGLGSWGNTVYHGVRLRLISGKASFVPEQDRE